MIPEEYQFLTTLPMCIVYAMLGMILHFFKKQIKGETLADIGQYFSQHFKSTFIAVTSTCIAVVAYYLTLSNDSPADIIAAFGTGYTFDSLFNKWEPK